MSGPAHDLDYDGYDDEFTSSGCCSIRSYYSNWITIRLSMILPSKSNLRKTQTQDKIVRGIYPMPEYLYAYSEDGERYDDSVIGK